MKTLRLILASLALSCSIHAAQFDIHGLLQENASAQFDEFTLVPVASSVLTLNGSKVVTPVTYASFLALIGAADASNLNANNLTIGTVPDARFPATLPALSGTNLTSLNASALSSGTVPDARLSANVSLLGSTISLTGEVTGITPVANGGTGIDTLGTGVQAALAIQVNTAGGYLTHGGGVYEVPLTFSTGLTRSTNTITVNASQNITTLTNLTSNGFVKTSGGTGALSIDTATYVPTTLIPFGPGAAGDILIGSSGATQWLPVTVSGDVTINSSGVTAIGANKVTGTMISLTGEAAGSIMKYDSGSGTWIVLPPGNTGEVLTATGGTAISWETPTGTGDMLKSVYDQAAVDYISGKNGGSSAAYLNMDNHSGTGNSGGHVKTYGGTGSGAYGGDVLTYGGTATDAHGGIVNTRGGTAANAEGGGVVTNGGTLPGGNVYTYDGGGSINTRGTGRIEFGAGGTRTTLDGTATSDRNIDLPDKSGIVALTSDIPVKAQVNFDGSTAANVSGTYSRTGTTVTVTLTNHAYLVGHCVYLDFTTGLAADGLFLVATVVDANNFTVTHGTSGATSGNVTLNRRLINGSSGVHSVTWNTTSTNVYYVNFSAALTDANYATSTDAVTPASAVGYAWAGFTFTFAKSTVMCPVHTLSTALGVAQFTNTSAIFAR
jgi:fibronectin-binding autotransporter adhesin